MNGVSAGCGQSRSSCRCAMKATAYGTNPLMISSIRLT